MSTGVSSVTLAIASLVATGLSAFSYTPSYGSSIAAELKLRKAQFGDGYTQRSAVGINNTGEAWSLVFATTPLGTMEAIRDFFKARSNGTSFLWAPYDGSGLIKVICPKWNIVASGFNTYDISCEFEQVYGE